MSKLTPSWLAALSGILTGRSFSKCGPGRAARTRIPVLSFSIPKTTQKAWRDVDDGRHAGQISLACSTLQLVF
jgi:hypothetical protein